MIYKLALASDRRKEPETHSYRRMTSVEARAITHGFEFRGNDGKVRFPVMRVMGTRVRVGMALSAIDPPGTITGFATYDLGQFGYIVELDRGFYSEERYESRTYVKRLLVNVDNVTLLEE